MELSLGLVSGDLCLQHHTEIIVCRTYSCLLITDVRVPRVLYMG
jgi:hypothetical protein